MPWGRYRKIASALIWTLLISGGVLFAQTVNESDPDDELKETKEKEKKIPSLHKLPSEFKSRKILLSPSGKSSILVIKNKNGTLTVQGYTRKMTEIFMDSTADSVAVSWYANDIAEIRLGSGSNGVGDFYYYRRGKKDGPFRTSKVVQPGLHLITYLPEDRIIFRRLFAKKDLAFLDSKTICEKEDCLYRFVIDGCMLTLELENESREISPLCKDPDPTKYINYEKFFFQVRRKTDSNNLLEHTDNLQADVHRTIR